MCIVHERIVEKPSFKTALNVDEDKLVYAHHSNHYPTVKRDVNDRKPITVTSSGINVTDRMSGSAAPWFRRLYRT